MDDPLKLAYLFRCTNCCEVWKKNWFWGGFVTGYRERKPMKTPSLTEFVKVARDQCCNFASEGPFRRHHYCSCEPRQSEHQCLLLHGLPCRWFGEAVLPTEKNRKEGLTSQWSIALENYLKGSRVTPPPKPVESDRGEVAILKVCECGKRFEAKSNRQTRCPECQQKGRLRSMRESSRRYRHRMGTGKG